MEEMLRGVREGKHSCSQIDSTKLPWSQTPEIKCC